MYFKFASFMVTKKTLFIINAPFSLKSRSNSNDRYSVLQATGQIARFLLRSISHFDRLISHQIYFIRQY